jgi:hypothetical protein
MVLLLIARYTRFRFFSARCILVDANDRGINDRELVVEVGGHRVEDALPNAGLGPTQETRVHRFPFRIMRRQVTPWRPYLQDPQHRVDHHAVGPRLATGSAVVRRQQILDSEPLLLRQLVTMSCHQAA